MGDDWIVDQNGQNWIPSTQNNHACFFLLNHHKSHFSIHHIILPHQHLPNTTYHHNMVDLLYSIIVYYIQNHKPIHQSWSIIQLNITSQNWSRYPQTITKPITKPSQNQSQNHHKTITKPSHNQLQTNKPQNQYVPFVERYYYRHILYSFWTHFVVVIKTSKGFIV